MSLQAGFGGIVLLTVLAFATGFWLMVSGGASRRLVLALHIALALAAGALAFFAVYQSVPAAGFPAAVSLTLAITALLYAGALLTGGFLSLQKPMPGAVKSLHLVLPALSVVGLCGTFLLLVSSGR